MIRSIWGRRPATLLLPVLLLAMLASCSAPQLTRALGSQEGLASYYSNDFQGKRTSNGEVFDNQLLTAAHRTYPFGTKVLVTNLATSESVEVTINDRGPRKPERVIDLTERAARAISLFKAGLGRVRLEVLEWGANTGQQKRFAN